VDNGPLTNGWRSLRVGDKIRITCTPSEVWAPHGETKAQFEYLVHSHLVVKVARIDEMGYPRIEYTRLSDEGAMIYESMMIDHDDVEVVRDSA
jgi:hypothetical protein